MPLSRAIAISALSCVALSALAAVTTRQARAQASPGTAAAKSYVLRPARVFDGIAAEPHTGWAVVVTGERIVSAGPASEARLPAGATTVDLPGLTLLPGLIEAHSHLLLHPYNEASWDDQVLHEPLALRVARATNHARATLLAGFTTVRDLGSEGAGYADVGLKQAIAQGIIPGPRMIVVTRAIVATGSYGPKGFTPEFAVPQGAEEADGIDGLTRVVRDQIGKGADWIKIYADYRWGPNGESRPTFTVEEITHIVDVARSSGRPVVAHASTAEGMRRAILGGVETIEHGDGGTPEVFRLMAEKGVALCPTVAAGDAILSYRGWRRGADADRSEPADLADVASRFLRAVHPGADQLELRMREDALHGDAADVAGRPLDHAKRHASVLPHRRDRLQVAPPARDGRRRCAHEAAMVRA